MSRARPTPPPTADHDGFATQLLAWFDLHGRHDLPWQHPRSPYRVWLSEIMLQQTQVATVIAYFQRFVDGLPDLPALAAAPQEQVLALWSGLGYYARARNLHAAARACVERHGGELPRDLEALVALPGIGRSTAAAILSQAWGDRHAILDGNVKRVLARYHGVEGWPGAPKVEKRLWAFAEAHVADPALPDARMADYTQAQMDLGATLCTRSKPTCLLCPLRGACAAHRDGLTDSLPTPRPGKTLPRREAQLLWLEDAQGRILLQQRPSTGVWASLWTLPQADDATLAREWLATHADPDYDAGEALPSIAHAFSHFRLDLHPRRWRAVALRERVGDNGDLRWVPRTQLTALGIPAPIRKLLESSDATPADHD
ncbi:A/G-specific adenine glycosylase [Marilutibacter aestuarii]|uniref:Adenine DNA glycosylase n=1 Tax=Marilutibacter aestuarii TaxID=1706195 RepID=A0A508A323_9GAMM|nr:A/G-specific adenine glycosylase [Lysobacter aestuarii]TQD41355.1 A/G-specific adenine glycosylase [Lysobacter aestuarii]